MASLFRVIAATNKNFLARDPHDISLFGNRLGFSRFVPVILGPSVPRIFCDGYKILDDVFSIDVLQIPLWAQELRIVWMGRNGSCVSER